LAFDSHSGGENTLSVDIVTVGRRPLDRVGRIVEERCNQFYDLLRRRAAKNEKEEDMGFERGDHNQ
jgi:hypothetical protein